METFAPRLDILPPAQRALWAELHATPPEFTLYGGTAIALQLGHRQSVDFDFWSTERFESQRLLAEVPYLKDAIVTQQAADTLTVRIVRVGAPVLLSFFALPKLGQVEPALRSDDFGLKVASLLDIAGCKAVAVQQRAELKDYLDFDALLGAGVTLPEALAAATIVHGAQFNPQLTLKALSYFDDGSVRLLDAAARKRLMTAVRAVDCGCLPGLSFTRRHDAGGAA